MDLILPKLIRVIDYETTGTQDDESAEKIAVLEKDIEHLEAALSQIESVEELSTSQEELLTY